MYVFSEIQSDKYFIKDIGDRYWIIMYIIVK